ncbi:ArnT family glycosyltransferase [Hymenobacter daecheongensis]|nr:glycosyltransferase family 39 protein [Hymenobacter daecheongensis]
MESRNFVAAREMVAGGSWLIPTLNGEPRLAKPPLPTWAVAALQSLTGPTENLALLRLPAALAATLLVLFFWALARELTRHQPAEAAAPGRTAWLAALVLASSLLIIVTGREGQWDIFASSLMIGALWLLVRGWRQPGPAYAPLLGAGLLAGLSMLSKGPVAVYAVLLPFVGAYLVGQPGYRRQVVRQGRGTTLAAVVALLVGLSWPGHIGLALAPLALKVARTEVTSWGGRHVQPFWYYWSFFAFTGLWALVALLSLVWPYARPRLRGILPYAQILGWLVASLVLLSLVPEKKERYMLPLMPPLALLVAGLLRYWETWQATRPQPATPTADVWLLRGWGSLLVAVFLALPAAMVLSRLPGFGVGSIWFAMAVGVCGALTGWVGWGVRQVRPTALVAATLAGVGAIIGLLMPAYPGWEARKGTPGLRQLRDARQEPYLRRIATWRSLDTLHVKQVWAAGRAVPVWHPSVEALAGLREPVVLFSGGNAADRLPTGWERYVQLQLLDSFYLGQDQQSGYWRISRIDPLKHPHNKVANH